jgi:NADH-quinone oxidoreductase subunit J
MDPIFAIASGLAVGSGLLLVTQRNPIYSALCMLVCFMSLAVLYLRLAAPFLAAIHVLVYTGAILVLFLFVIMLLNLKPEELGEEHPLPVRAGAGVLCGGLVLLLALPLSLDDRKPAAIDAAKDGFGSVTQVGEALFRTFPLPFELVSVLVMAAVFGGVALAKRKI